MNRDELLTQMAMENAQWPAWGGQPVLHGDQWFLPDEYQQRRNELINKPSWDNAPEWAQWLAQDADGDWVWFEVEPEPDHEEWLEKENFDGDIEEASKGKTPSGHDWRETLERRLEWPEDRMDVIGSNGPTGDHYMTQEEEDMPAKGRWSNPESLAEDLARMQAKYLSDTTPAESILAAARQHMMDRASTYDKPDGERSMGATIDAFRAVTGIDMTEEQGWLFMQLLKAVRSQQGDYRADSYEDGAAYVALAGEAAARDRKNQ